MVRLLMQTNIENKTRSLDSSIKEQTMARFHVGRDGNPKECTAEPGKCPLGGEHYDSLEKCEAAIEKNAASHSGDKSLKKPDETSESNVVGRLRDSLLEEGKKLDTPAIRKYRESLRYLRSLDPEHAKRLEPQLSDFIHDRLQEDMDKVNETAFHMVQSETNEEMLSVFKDNPYVDPYIDYSVFNEKIDEIRNGTNLTDLIERWGKQADELDASKAAVERYQLSKFSKLLCGLNPNELGIYTYAAMYKRDNAESLRNVRRIVDDFDSHSDRVDNPGFYRYLDEIKSHPVLKEMVVDYTPKDKDNDDFFEFAPLSRSRKQIGDEIERTEAQIRKSIVSAAMRGKIPSHELTEAGKANAESTVDSLNYHDGQENAHCGKGDAWSVRMMGEALADAGYDDSKRRANHETDEYKKAVDDYASKLKLNKSQKKGFFGDVVNAAYDKKQLDELMSDPSVLKEVTAERYRQHGRMSTYGYYYTGRDYGMIDQYLLRTKGVKGFVDDHLRRPINILFTE